MDEWTGTIAYLDRETEDGRTLATPETSLETRPLPLPLLNSAGEFIGEVARVFIDGDELKAEGTIDEGVLRPGQKRSAGVNVDRIGPDLCSTRFTQWRLYAVIAYTDGRPPAWPDAHIRLKNESAA